MLRFTFVLILFVEFTLAQSQNNECIDVSNPLYRTFKSLVDYQGNKVSFDPRDKDYQGNLVKFSDGAIKRLPKNSFFTYESHQVRELSLSGHQIEVIDDGAFLSLNCVSILKLGSNKIDLITPNAFEGLHHLHRLDLSDNKIVEIPERVFRFTVILQKLNLSRNSLKVLHTDSFYRLTMLEELDISYNYLHKVNPDILRYFNKLTNLQIGSNQFEYLELENWYNLTSLKILNVSNNELKSIDFLYNFTFSFSLTELYLDDNYLTQFNVRGFRKHLPNVKVIDISENLWLCADLVEILRYFNDSRIDYKGTETTDPNFGGIACNRSAEEYQEKKYREPDAVPSTTTTAKPATSIKPAVNEQVSLNSIQILNSIKSLETMIICLFVVVVVFIFIEFLTRCKWRRFRRYNNSPILDNSNVEDISLLRGRF